MFQEKLRNLMSLDGENLFTIVKCIHLLVLPRIVFIELNDHFSKVKVGAVLGFNCCITVILSIWKRERSRISRSFQTKTVLKHYERVMKRFLSVQKTFDGGLMKISCK